LIQAWDKHIEAMDVRRKAKNSKEMNDYMNKIYKIKPEIRDCVLEQFAQRCLQKHCLAFF
jgi:hypothetical protein